MSGELEHREQLEELRKQQQELVSRVDALSIQVTRILEALTGDDIISDLDGMGQANNVLTRLNELEEELREQQKTVSQMPEQNGQGTSTQARVTRIRQYMVGRAAARDANVYHADYKEIGALFDREISDSWAATLLKKAAGVNQTEIDADKSGFRVIERKPRNQLEIQVDKIDDGSLLRLKNSEGKA